MGSIIGEVVIRVAVPEVVLDYTYPTSSAFALVVMWSFDGLHHPAMMNLIELFVIMTHARV